MLVLGVYHGNVYLEVGDAHVAAAVVTVVGKLCGNILAYARLVDYHFVALHGYACASLFCKFEEGLEPRNAARICAREVYH